MQAPTEFGSYEAFPEERGARVRKGALWLWISLLGILAAGVAGALLILRSDPLGAAPVLPERATPANAPSPVCAAGFCAA